MIMMMMTKNSYGPILTTLSMLLFKALQGNGQTLTLENSQLMSCPNQLGEVAAFLETNHKEMPDQILYAHSQKLLIGSVLKLFQMMIGFMRLQDVEEELQLMMSNMKLFYNQLLILLVITLLILTMFWRLLKTTQLLMLHFRLIWMLLKVLQVTLVKDMKLVHQLILLITRLHQNLSP